MSEKFHGRIFPHWEKMIIARRLWSEGRETKGWILEERQIKRIFESTT